MTAGGVVKRGLVDGMDEDGAEDTPANIEEFMTMVAGGLAGATPHMISATVTAISRIEFEFKREPLSLPLIVSMLISAIDVISSKMHNDILTTMIVLLSSANREIIKSVLGFIKLVIHTLPLEILRPHLKELVPALLNWSHDHKNHFKLKVRHIFERMLRRINWDELYGYAGEEEASKVLVNIKKRKERAKRKKANRKDDEADEVRGRLTKRHSFSINPNSNYISFDHQNPLQEMHSKMCYMEAKAKLRIATTNLRMTLRQKMMAVVSDCEWMMKSQWICSMVPQARLQARPFFRLCCCFLTAILNLNRPQVEPSKETWTRCLTL